MSEFLNIKLKTDHNGLKANHLYSAEKLDNGNYNIWADGTQVTGITEEMILNENEEVEVPKKKDKKKSANPEQEIKIVKPFFENIKAKTPRMSNPLMTTLAFVIFVFIVILVVDTCSHKPNEDVEKVSKNVPASYQEDTRKSDIVIEDESKVVIDFVDEYVDALIAKSKAKYMEQKVPQSAINSIDYNNPIIRNAAREVLIDQLARIIQNSSLEMTVLDTLDSEEYNFNKAYKNQIHSKIIK